MLTVRYVQKDGDWILDGITPTGLEAFLKSPVKTLKHDVVANRLLAGEEIMDMMHEMPGYWLVNLSRAIKFSAFVTIKNNATIDFLFRKMSISECQCAECCDDLGMPAPLSDADREAAVTISDWFNVVLHRRRMHIQPGIREQQLYIYAPPGSGKTTTLDRLRKCVPIYDLPVSKFFDGYRDHLFDLIVADEFHGEYRIKTLNQWLDGSVLPLEIKGSQMVKRDRVPVVILANEPPEYCYRAAIADNPNAIQGLVGLPHPRLQVVSANVRVMHALEIHMDPKLTSALMADQRRAVAVAEAQITDSESLGSPEYETAGESATLGSQDTQLMDEEVDEDGEPPLVSESVSSFNCSEHGSDLSLCDHRVPDVDDEDDPDLYDIGDRLPVIDPITFF